MKPIVAIVGRPNVGKSTLFNRITHKRDALVDGVPGITRDRHYADAAYDDREFTLVDTGGFTDADAEGFAVDIVEQIAAAVQEADVIILVLDGKGGISPFDQDVVRFLRPAQKPLLFAVNKIDGPDQEDRLHDFHGLGADTLFSLSAEHGYGLHDFMDRLILELDRIETKPEPDFPEAPIKLAVVGRPNVGKSSLINRLLGEDRLLVRDTPGTTRDAIDSLLRINEKAYLFIDTAGIRRKSKVDDKLEKFSVIKALRSLDRCDVALVMLDAEEGVTDQDIRIAGYAYERGCAILLLINKIDRIQKDTGSARKLVQRLRSETKFIGFAPILTVSAKTGFRVKRIFDMVDEIHRQYTLRIGTGSVNQIFHEAVEAKEPPLHQGRRIRFYYATQVSTKPPTFVVFVNYPEAVHFSYKRYLINQIRDRSRLDKTPIRILFRKRTGRKRRGSV